MFWSETFLQVFLEIFFQVSRTRSRYLGSPLNLILCVGKKIVTIRHTNQIILQKTCWGEIMPFPSIFKINQSLHDLLRQKMYFICYERTKPETDLKSFVVAYCHFEPLFKIFCWTINSAKFSLLREKIRFLLLL